MEKPTKNDRRNQGKGMEKELFTYNLKDFGYIPNIILHKATR